MLIREYKSIVVFKIVRLALLVFIVVLAHSLEVMLEVTQTPAPPVTLISIAACTYSPSDPTVQCY